MKDYKYDYLLSGHFHGGQIHWPKPYHLAKMGKLVRMNMVKGLHYHNGMPFYISEGLGQTGVNIRIGSRPEITFHEIA
ncbi:phosphodiesterase YaeI [Mycobacteroides abscessus subsp. abscessus]|nr:phosphodiesterase YaeI [Mycobacteroides abscessus subsp. abscessus]